MFSVHDSFGVYLYASPSTTALIGWHPDELVGETAYEYFHPDDVAAIMQSHEASVFAEAETVVQFRIRCKEGGYKWVETTSRTVEEDGVKTIYTVTRGLPHRAPDVARDF